MKTELTNGKVARIGGVAGVSLAVWLIAMSVGGPASAEERQFLVILANSPKQYPGPHGTAMPEGGLLNRQVVSDQYFDRIRPDIGSFAEYWEEISYGDVRISGFVTDWINLPWAIQPPLVDPSRDNGTPRPPVNDNLDDPAIRRTPAAYYDLDGNGAYLYGVSEEFDNSVAGAIIDLDGDPGGRDNGPDSFAQGSRHAAPPNAVYGYPVWKPGERFIDMDEDGRWDGLDEARNESDRNFDGRPDLRGRWIDLNNNGEPDNPSNCVYLRDSDNDGNPDCCPNGPGSPSCTRFGATGGGLACPATTWEGPDGTFDDCNGNLVPDPCDVDCNSADCAQLRWSGPCGGSLDRLPFATEGNRCEAGDGDGIPDECQFANASVPCVAQAPSSTTDPCISFPVCNPINRTPVPRCEYEDVNDSGTMDIVEPFENFLRRWDPCVEDPESDFRLPRVVRHWVKVYDPSSPQQLTCGTDGRVFRTDEPTYIINNYPGRAKVCETTRGPCGSDDDCPDASPFPNRCKTGTQILIEEAGTRVLYGEHDPSGRISAPEQCVCAIPFPDGPNPFACRDVQIGKDVLRNACIAGFFKDYNPPDFFRDRSSTQPGNVETRTTKMQPVAEIDVNGLLLEITPKPGTYPVFGGVYDEPWYEQAWSDRYNADGCPNLNYDPANPSTYFPLSRCTCESSDFDPLQGPGPNNPPHQECEIPAWPQFGHVRRIVPFRDVDPTTYSAETNRRYFRANAGGLNGDGTGWIGCNQAVDGIVEFETGNLPTGFQQNCNRRILPEELAGGANQPATFFDGWVEHDDMPSSKYHRAGDQRLGEVTSPFSNNIWGQDRGPGVSSPAPIDFILPAAGPYATRVHGNNGRDAGNQLTIEYLSWRTQPPFNNGYAWEFEQANSGIIRFHPYAGPSGGANLGFRDYNLDGLIDQGEVRPIGSENYQSDSEVGTSNDGVFGLYPFNRDRMMEDVIEILDDLVDFDDFVDSASMHAAACDPQASFFVLKPGNLWDVDTPLDNIVIADGVCSGILILPPRAISDAAFRRSPGFIPIHNEDYNGTADAFPQAPYVPQPPNGVSPDVWNALFKPRLSWNIFFHNLVTALGTSEEGGGSPSDNVKVRFAAHEWLHAWQHLPDLYDYDIFAPPPQPLINCPIGNWDIMADGGLVHPTPILKEDRCTQWIKAVDLATVLTPGVDATLTLPRYEFVRDDSVYFLENEARSGEKYWFWSVGSGFDERMPGEGMLIMHTDPDGSNPEALPSGQSNGTRFFYHIIQADGLSHLDDCTSRGDAGDPWPGSANRTRFGRDTVPSATWYTQNSWTGIDISDIVSDGQGSVQLRINWVPTSLPSLRFTDPPGGVSVPVGPTNTRYRVRFLASDVFGGTTIRMYYTLDPTNLTVSSGNFVGELQKSTPGTNELSIDWNIHGRPDGRYFLFAELLPGQGADGTEVPATNPRAGRNNVGNGALSVDLVNIAGHKARLETWTAVCVSADGMDWKVNSSLTQPVTLPDSPALHARTGQQYTSLNDAVKFTIQAGTTPFAKDDSFTFTTTGITAVSQGVTITDGQIKEDPTARIIASPLSGDPPLTVQFDARSSVEPNGEPLEFHWSFGDGTTDTSPAPTHTYVRFGRFTVVLRATNPRNGRFGEARVDIDVTNNSPNAVIAATPTSGPAPLTVTFNAGQSSDIETPSDQLIYQWDFGDGQTANDAQVPGVLIQTTHFYSQTAGGRACTSQAPCLFTAMLTVTDEGGKQDTDTIQIRVGNTNPIVNITAAPLQGTAPLEVTFNAINSTDADGDTLTVDWDFGDGQTLTNVPKTGPVGSTDGRVLHTYTSAGTYHAKAVVKDTRGGQTAWSGATITVTQGGGGGPGQPPTTELRAIFTFAPENPKVGEEITFDASGSFVAGGGAIAAYTWDWGDGTPPGAGVTAKHTYRNAGRYTVALTVADSSTPPRSGRTERVIVVVEEDEEETQENRPPTAVFVVAPGLQGTVGQTFRFDARGSSDPDGDQLRYRWSFGDGLETLFTSTPTTSHAYEEAGTYFVRLTVRDELNATATATQTIRILGEPESQAPTAVIASGPRTVSQGQAITFDGSLSSDPDGDPLTYTWTFTFGGIPDEVLSGVEVTKVFTRVGAYTVDLEVSDPDGNTDSAETEEVVVRPAGPVTPPEPPPPTERPDEEPPDSAGQRPTGLAFCGVGMLPAVVLMLLGLGLIRGLRWRTWNR